LDKETKEEQEDHEGVGKLFPPSAFDATQEELVRTYRFAVKMALGSILGFTSLLFFAMQTYYGREMAKSGG
jgi:hypothetical protein